MKTWDRGGRARGPAAAVTVLSPSMLLTITIEHAGGHPDCRSEVHVHAGGQGYWLARLLASLGHRPTLCAIVGGEAGTVIRGLLAGEAFDTELVHAEGPTATYVHDRRAGSRQEIVRTGDPTPSRHERDDLYGVALGSALRTGVCVVTGRASPDAVDLGFYERLGADLHANGVVVVGDLHGPELDAFLRRGRLALLKVSDEDLRQDGCLDGDEVRDVVAVARALGDRGVDRVVVSRGERATVAVSGGDVLLARPPRLREADHRGAGDSMTAALVSATVLGLDMPEALAVGCAAGAANVTRHGLTTLEPSLIDALVDRVQVQVLTEVEAGQDLEDDRSGVT